jgi:hypothetical protein
MTTSSSNNPGQELPKLLKQLFTVIFNLGNMSWIEKLMALNSIVSAVSSLTSALSPLTPDEVQKVLVTSMDAVVGDEKDAILGVTDTALIKVNPGLLGAKGFEMLSDLIIQTSANAIRSGMGK